MFCYQSLFEKEKIDFFPCNNSVPKSCFYKLLYKRFIKYWFYQTLYNTHYLELLNTIFYGQRKVFPSSSSKVRILVITGNMGKIRKSFFKETCTAS